MSNPNELPNEIKGLNESLLRLLGHPVLKSNANWRRIVWMQFIRGLAFGFGSVVGATIVVSIVGYVLNQMEVVPIVGQWATEIGREIISGSKAP